MTPRPRLLAIVAHPLPASESFTRALFDQAILDLAPSCDIDLCPLYEEGFSPLLSVDERRAYEDPDFLAPSLMAYRERLLAAHGLLLAYPTWVGGPPAILKGLFERLFKPGVTFLLSGRTGFTTLPTFQNLREALVFNPYGGGRTGAAFMGHYSRKFATREMRISLGLQLKVRYEPFYHTDRLTPARRAAYEGRAHRATEDFADRLSRVARQSCAGKTPRSCQASPDPE